MSTATLSFRPQVSRLARIAPVANSGEVVWPQLSFANTNDLVKVAIRETEPGSGQPLLAHTREDRIFFVQSGRYAFYAGGRRYEVGPGGVVYAPRNDPHTYRSIGPVAGCMTVIEIPTGEADEYAELSDVDGIVALEAWELSAYSAAHTVAPAKVITGNAGERLTVPGGCFRFLLEAHETEGRFGLVDLETPFNTGSPLHIHNREDELFLIQSGRYEFQVYNEIFQVGPGDLVWAPRPFPHCFRSVGHGPGRLLSLNLPGGFEGYVRRLHQQLNSAGFDHQALLSLQAEFGLESPVR